MVFQAEDDATLLRPRQELLEGADHPGESLVVGVALEARLDPLVGHQVIERFCRSPAAGVDAHRGDAEPVGGVDRIERLGDVVAPHGLVGSDEALVRREAHQRQSVGVGLGFEPLEAGIGLIVPHLHLEDLDAVESHPCGLVDAVLDRRRLRAELPEGIGRDAQPHRAQRWRRRDIPGKDASRGGQRKRPCSGGGEERAAVCADRHGHFPRGVGRQRRPVGEQRSTIGASPVPLNKARRPCSSSA